MKIERREFIELSAKSLGGLLIFSLAGEPMMLNAQEGTVKVPLRFFTEQEAKVVVAACERIFPATSATGPGATQAGVMVYIDHQLAGPYGTDKYRYTQEPFIESVDQDNGYQGKENPQETYRAGIPKLGADFVELDGAKQDERLRTVEKTHFFTLLRTHTIEGMFCDPMHGGNQGMIGWQMLGNPGPVMNFRDMIGKYNGVSYTAKPKSIAQMLGHPIKAWEDEERG